MNNTQTKQLQAAIQYATTILQGDSSGHNMDHINRVAKTTQIIANQTPNCNAFIALLGAYLHDTTDDKLVTDVALAKINLKKELEKIKLSNQEITAIFHIIENISFKESIQGTTEPLSIEAQVVQDADRIDAMGAIGIGRTFYYGGHKGHAMHDPAIPPRNLQTIADYRKCDSVINHFYEKLLLLKDKMNTPYGKKIAEERHRFMEMFLAEFLAEWG